MTAAFAVLGFFHIGFAYVAAAFLILGFVAPRALESVRHYWMKLAEALGWVNTRIILAIVYYLVITPIGLVMRLFGRSTLRGAYWQKPDPHSYGDKHFEKQF
jgi:hypothetical protein